MIDTRNPQYEKMQSRWRMCRDAAAGEYEVHQAGPLYLPKLNQERGDDYQARVEMTPFFGATWRTIITLRGMMFRKAPDIIIPDSMRDDLENIDNTGQTFNSFAQDVSLEGLTVGRVGILTDFSEVPQGITQADAQGLRSFLTEYYAEAILDWEYVVEGGIKKLAMVRLLEDQADYQGVELEKHQELHRVLSLTDTGYIQQVFIVDRRDQIQVGDDIIPTMRGATMNFIPFQPIGVDTLSMEVEIPPLMDLITLNFHHYRQSSAYERGCFLSGCPTLFIYGNNDDDKKIYVGGATANSFGDPSTKAEYVEVQSNFQALLENLKQKEQQMAVLGARMLEPKTSGVESAETWQRKQSGEESILADISTTVGQGLTKALQWEVEWMGGDPEQVDVQLNKEFLPFDMTPQEITAFMNAYLQRTVSFDTLYTNFKRAGLYSEDSTMEDELAKINEGAPGQV